MLKDLRREEQNKIASAAHKISSKYQEGRQIIRSNRKSRADNVLVRLEHLAHGTKGNNSCFPRRDCYGVSSFKKKGAKVTH